MSELKQTPMHAVHESRGAKMAPFAGYDMPINYPLGVLKEHLQVRASAGLFDVSHMGQIALRPRSGDVADAALALEALAPMNLLDLREGRQRYALLTDETGGVLDDLMVAHRGDHLLLVVNAANRDADLAHLQAALDESCEVEPLDRGLLALQGPKAEAALAKLHADVANMRFMDVREIDFRGVPTVTSRSGYSGEDGFEISLRPEHVVDFAELLLADEAVDLIGLGARDSLRLEAGLCLCGQDIDETTTPVEAALEWAIQPARRNGGKRRGGFPGAERILGQIESGADRRRVMLLPGGKAPMRPGVELYEQEGGPVVGRITSGGFGPSLNRPVAMGYVDIALAAPDTPLFGMLRGKLEPVMVAATPLIEPGYKRD